MYVRRQVIVVMLSIVLLLVVGCASNDSGASSDAGESTVDSNVNETGMPIVKEPITLDFFVGVSHATSQHDWNNVTVWNEYAEMTNIDVNWNQISPEAIQERRNLALAGGDLPDVFFASAVPANDLLRYGEQGIFVPLNDLIDKYAPNFKKLMEDNPEIERAITFPDGNIYSLPNIAAEDFTSLRVGAMPWINTDWLEALDMDMPETTDEFYEYLKGVKEEDVSGTGQNDEIPYGGTQINHLIQWLQGAFGINNRGDGMFDIAEDGNLRFIPTADGYKEMLEYLHKLYDEELIEQNIFSIEHAQYLANRSSERYGSTVFWAAEEFEGTYDSASALVGPHGDQAFTSVLPIVSGLGEFAITSENEHPEATMRWIDHFYTDEGTKLMYLGIEGVTYEEGDDGRYKQAEALEELPTAELQEEVTKHVTWQGVNPPGLTLEDYFLGAETLPLTLDGAERIAPYLPETTWSDFTYTLEENQRLSALRTDIETYVEEMRDQFIIGRFSFSEWDDYVDTIENMGLEEYMSIQEDAYERYLNVTD